MWILWEIFGDGIFLGGKTKRNQNPPKLFRGIPRFPRLPKIPKIFGNFLPTSPNPGDHFGMNGGRKKRIPGISQGSAQVGEKKKSLWDILGFFFSPNSGLSQEKSLPGSRLQRPQIPIFSWNFSPPGKNGHEGDSG